jgi:hypothetical protein
MLLITFLILNAIKKLYQFLFQILKKFFTDKILLNNKLLLMSNFIIMITITNLVSNHLKYLKGKKI